MSISLLAERLSTVVLLQDSEPFGVENKESRLTLEPCHSKPHDLILKSMDILHHEQTILFPHRVSVRIWMSSYLQNT